VTRTWAEQALCPLDTLADGAVRGFVVSAAEGSVEIFVRRDGEKVVGFVNACPHVGTPHDLMPDQFLSADGRNYLCRTHGALFRLDDGYCIKGPCQGKSLEPVPVTVEGDRILIAGPAAPA